MADTAPSEELVRELAALAAVRPRRRTVRLAARSLPELEEKLNIRVLDPTAVALKVAEAMADLGLTHSKRAMFAFPPEKVFK